MPTAADPIRVAIINDYEVVVRGLADIAVHRQPGGV